MKISKRPGYTVEVRVMDERTWGRRWVQATRRGRRPLTQAQAQRWAEAFWAATGYPARVTGTDWLHS